MTADIDEKPCQRCGETFRRTKGRTRKEFERRKYCGEICAQRAIPRPGKPKRERCYRDLHDLDDANSRIDCRGHRSCKACAAENQRQRDAAKTRQRKPPPTPAPVEVIPRVIPAAERPIWRPPGWTPQPTVRRTT